MEIRVLGSGCSKCHSTIGIIERAAQAWGVDLEIVKVENPGEIERAGVRATPAVMIDGKVVHSEEVAVFHAFSRIVSEGRSAFVVLDTAPTGHSMLLMDATGAYHRQMTHEFEGHGAAHQDHAGFA